MLTLIIRLNLRLLDFSIVNLFFFLFFYTVLFERKALYVADA